MLKNVRKGLALGMAASMLMGSVYGAAGLRVMNAAEIKEGEVGLDDSIDIEVNDSEEISAQVEDTESEEMESSEQEENAELDNEIRDTDGAEELLESKSVEESEAFLADEEIEIETVTEISETLGAEIVASGECGADGDNVTWMLDSKGTLTISGTGDMNNYDLLWDNDYPPYYDYKNDIEHVEIKDGVVSIGHFAFIHCLNLKSISIPVGVTSIGNDAFESCESMESLFIPNSVTSIGEWAFAACYSLKSISIPNSVTSIKDGAFCYCKGVESVSISSNVESIGKWVFYDCESLESVSIPEGVRNIEGYSFYDCSSLKSIFIPESTMVIGEQAFINCASLSDVYYSGSEEQWERITKEKGNECLENATIHYNSRGSIGEDRALNNCLIILSPTSFSYDGTEKKPTITVKRLENGSLKNDYLLEEGKHYTVSYENNVDAGRAKVILQGIGDYTGKIIKYFDIVSEKSDNTSQASDFKIGSSQSGESKDPELLRFFPGDWKLSVANYPVKLKKTTETDGSYKVKLSIGIGREDILDDETEWDKLKKCIDDAEKSEKTYANLARLIDANGKWRENIKTNHFDVMPKLGCMGYGEIKLDKDGNVLSQTVKVAATADWKKGATWAFATPIGPMYFEWKFGAKAKGKIGPKYDIKNDKWVIMDGSFSVEPYGSIEGGYGFAKIATIGAKGEAKVPITIIPQSSGKIEASANVHLYAMFLVDEEYTLAKLTVPLWGDNSNMTNVSYSADTLFSPEEYLLEPISEDYIDTAFTKETTEWEGEVDVLTSSRESGVNILQEGILPSSLPMMTSIGSKKVLVWQAFDKDGDKLNACKLMYSVFENGQWSEPKIVNNDGTSDFYADFKTINGKAVLVWQNMDTKLGSEEDVKSALMEMGSHSKIYAAIFNPNHNQFETVMSVSGEETGMMPQVFEDGTKTVITYVQNSNDDMMQASGTNSILRRTLEAGDLSGKTTLITTKDMVENYVYQNGDVYYVSRNASDDTQAAALRNKAGQVVSSSDGIAENVSNVMNAGGKIVYLENGLLYVCGSGNTSSLIGDVILGSGTKFCTNGSKTGFVWTEYDEASDVGRIKASLLGDSGYSEAITLYETEGSIYRCISPELDDNDQWQIAACVENSKSGLCSLVYIERNEATDMALDYASINEFDVQENGDTGVDYYVTNTSDKKISDVIMEVKASDGSLLATKEVDITIAPGESTSGTEYLDLSGLSGATDVELLVYAKGQNDIVDNVVSETVGLPDVSVSANYAEDEENVYIFTDLSNTSANDAENVRLSISEDDKNLHSESGISISSRGEKTIECSLAKSDIFYNSDGIAYLKLEAEAGDGDYSLDNNVDYVILYGDKYDGGKGDDYDPFPTVAPDSDSIPDPESDPTPSPTPSTVSVTGVKLNKESDSIEAGRAITLQAIVSPVDASNKSVTWKSSDEKIATVDSSGKVTGIAEGKATITVTTEDGNKTAVCEITVNPEKKNISNATIEAIGDQKYTGKEIKPTVVVKYDGITLVEGTDYSVTYKDNVDVGDASIIIEGKGEYAESKTVTFAIVPVNVTGVSLSKTDLSIVEGKTATLTATVAPADATNRKVAWKSSNTNIVSVDSNGKISALKVGTADIIVTTDDGNKTAKCSVTVKSATVAVTGVKLNKSSASVNVGKEVTLSATILPKNATNKKVTWSSSNKSIATVNSSGVVKGVKKGSATITVTTIDQKKTAKCTVTVKPISVSSVSLDKKTSSIVKGKIFTLKATVSPSDATNKNVTWKSSNTKIATVSSKGVVKGVKAGTTTITVTTKDGKKTASCKVKVTNPVVKVKSVKLNKKSASVKKGKTLTLKATISPSNATNKSVTWKTSNKKIAAVTSKGVVKGVKKGTATITATTKDGKKTAKCKVTVK
ncbi:MAG: Ig-like domain-containing protein [Lachnospiraceae bacterium]|nr:Ig-like domain-containing protein [Lachnospiraceae bacterium]